MNWVLPWTVYGVLRGLSALVEPTSGSEWGSVCFLGAGAPGGAPTKVLPLLYALLVSFVGRYMRLVRERLPSELASRVGFAQAAELLSVCWFYVPPDCA